MSDFAERYRAVIVAQIQKKQRHINNGDCQSYEDYKAKCAETAGLGRALQEFNDLYGNYVEEDGGGL